MKHKGGCLVWGLFILFILGAIGFIAGGEIISGILCGVIAAMCCPFIDIKKWIRIAGTIALILAMGALMPDSVGGTVPEAVEATEESTASTEAVATEAADVQPETHMSNIVAVQLCLDRDREFVPAVDLCPAGQAWHAVVGPILIPLGHQIVLVPESGARAHNAHFPFQDIEQLRQLIQTGLAQKMPHRRNERIRIFQHMGGHIVRRIGAHTAEFVDGEKGLALSHPFLLEQHRAGAGEFYAEGQHDQQGRKNDHSQQAENEIHNSLETGSVHGAVTSSLLRRHCDGR